MTSVATKPAGGLQEIPDVSLPALPTHRPLRILLVKPDISDVSVGFATLARVPPLELITVAGIVPQHEVRVFDARLETEGAFVSELRDLQPDLVGMTAYSAEAEQAKAMCRLAKSVCEGIVVVQGGYHASMAPADALNEPAVDFIARFEAEQTLPELLAALQNGDGFNEVAGIGYVADERVWLTPRRAPLPELDATPFPRWDLVARYQRRYYLNVLGHVATLETTRGCRYDCSFCSVWVFYDRLYRKKSAGRVLEEMERLPASDVVGFVDDEFWVDGRRSLELADRISAKPRDWGGKARRYFAQVRISDIRRTPELVARWGRAGMKVLLLGIESHKQDEVDSLHNKRTNLAHADFALRTMREHGVEAWGCFIVNPEWEEQDFDDLAEFVVRHDIAFPQFTVLTPLPGTRLTDRLVASGKLELSKLQFPLLDFLHAAVPTRLPLRRFYEKVAQLYARTSMEGNLTLYRRALHNGVINREWLRSDMGRKVRAVFAQLADPESYLRAHRMLGQDV